MMADQGAFAAGEFPSLLRQLLVHGAEGRLDVTAGGTVRRIYVAGGRVHAVVSESEEEKLGRWLADREVVERQRMLLSLLKQPRGRPLGAQLVEDGLLPVETLRTQLEERAAALIARLVAVNGTWILRKGERLPEDVPELDLDLDATVLFLRTGRACDAALLAQTVLRADQRLHVVEGVLQRWQDLPLTEQEGFVLSRIGDGVTKDELVRLTPSGQAEVHRSLAALVLAGLVEYGAEAPPPASTTPPARQNNVDGRGELTREQQRECDDVSRLAAELRFRDFYRVLGLSRGAMQDQIHERFRERARLYNPERATEPHLRSLRKELTDIQKALQDAYRTLIQPDRRARYDKLLKEGEPSAAKQLESEDRRDSARRELVDANLRRAQELIHLGEVGEAIQLLDQAVRFDPQPETLLLLAQLERRNPMWSQRALDRLKWALTIDPRYTDAWLELSHFWGARKHTARQRDCLKRILEYDPNNKEVKAALAKVTGG